MLTGASGPFAGQRWTVSGDAAVIGRHASANVRIDDRSISRTHCRIVRADGEFYVEDAGGQNGTFVDGKRVTSRTRIGEGTRLGVAEVELTASILVPVRAAAAPTLAAIGGTMVVDLSEALAAADAAPAPQPAEMVEPAGAAPRVAPTEEGEARDGEVGTSDGSTDEIVSDETAEEVPQGSALPATISLDELTAAAAAFWVRFEVARGALLRFRDRYAELGGRDAAIDLAAQAMVIEEQPGDAAALLAFGQHAKRVEDLALAAVELADAMGYGIENVEATEQVETEEDVETAEDGSSAADKE